MGRATSGRKGFQYSETDHPSRSPTCSGICLNFRLYKKRTESIYDYAVLCSNCEMYIPRDSIIKVQGRSKYCCPCCKRTHLRGLYRKTVVNTQAH